MKSGIVYFVAGIVAGVIGAYVFAPLRAPTGPELPNLPAPYYKTLFENDAVRIVEHQLEAGQTEPMHGHPPMFVYFISGANVEISTPDGSTFEETLVHGLTFDLPALEHSIANVGDSPLKSILVEFK